ncbi:cation transport regulator ChaB [Planosporangium thailandense]|uniref:Cation transport regulator ChaB n=1 Tax=Planosporangium thailandense TaxID=765197 RepID=A0ABX0Y937_9ACTN|nr:ChaB family protein [Planosporangium thailandense]NJC73902.1 cation transport regulator ChaB [Planosporangium thailandense]
MPGKDKHGQAEEMRDEVPSTIARSDDKAVRTYEKTLESAEETYGPGERARRIAYASLKHTHEKVGDHWEPKERTGPSDPQAEQGTPQSGRQQRDTAQGVDAYAPKVHLDEVARKVGIEHPEDLNKSDLVAAIQKVNARATAEAREKGR